MSELIYRAPEFSPLAFLSLWPFGAQSQKSLCYSMIPELASQAGAYTAAGRGPGLPGKAGTTAVTRAAAAGQSGRRTPTSCL